MFISIGKFTSSPTFGSVDNGLGSSCKAPDFGAEVATVDARSDVGAVSGSKGRRAIPHR